MTDPKDQKDRKFEMELPIAAPRDAVWQAVSEAKEIARWFAPDVEVRPGPGGAMRWQWGQHHDWPLEIETWEPGRHLRLSYLSNERPIYVDFFLEGDAGTTKLRLVHSGFGPDASFDEEYDGISSGWPVELRSLKHYLENHAGKDRHVAWGTVQVDVEPDEAWQRLVGPKGLGNPGIAGTKPGAPFAVTVPSAGKIEGTALVSPGPREFSGRAKSHGDGWFRVNCYRWGPKVNLWVWLALYGEAGAQRERFQRAFDDMLSKLFAGDSTAAEQGA